MTPPPEQPTTIESVPTAGSGPVGPSGHPTTLADPSGPAKPSANSQISAADVLALGGSPLSDQGPETPTAQQLEALVEGRSAPDVQSRTDAASPEPTVHQRHSPPRVVKPRKVRALVQAHRQGGVAPYVAPAARRTRRQRRRDYRRQGFIELTQEPQKRRHRILPRTVIGISVTVFAMGVGAAFAAAALYTYYDYRLNENEVQVSTLVDGFQAEFSDAEDKIANLRNDSIESINESLAPLEHYADIEVSMAALSEQLAPSVWFVQTLDDEGKPAVGSAFVVQSGFQESLLLTSYSVVRQATIQPTPPVRLEYAGTEVLGQVHTWDEDRDLALITIELGGLTAVEWAPNEANARAVGRPIYAVSGLGGAGASVTDGRVVDNNFSGIQHTATIGHAWRGGPLVNEAGQVLAVASLTYQPLGFDPGAVQFAIHVSEACERVLTCSEQVRSTGGPPLPEATGNGAEPTEDSVPETVED